MSQNPGHEPSGRPAKGPPREEKVPLPLAQQQEPGQDASPEEPQPPEPLENLYISTETKTALEKRGIEDAQELREFLDSPQGKSLEHLPGIGPKGILEIREALGETISPRRKK